MRIKKLYRDFQDSGKISVESAHEYTKSTSFVGNLNKFGETVLEEHYLTIYHPWIDTPFDFR